MIFRQLFEPQSSAYTYLIACDDSREAALIDPVLETVERDLALLDELGLALRYTIETFTDVLPVDLRALREPAVRLQKLLGDVHDIDMALGVVQAANEIDHATRHALLNALVEKRAKKIDAFEQEMRPKMPAESPPEPAAP